jgi:hypothetical protein
MSIAISSLTRQLADSPATSPLTPLVERLATRVDANHDGTVTSGEFAAFLSQLTASIDGDASGSASPAPADAAISPSAAAAVRAFVAALAKE